MKKKLIAIGLAAAMSMTTVGLMTGCSGADITVSGSSSVSPLMERLAQEYMDKLAADDDSSNDVEIEVITSDSGTGVSDAQNGRNDFGMASRDLKDNEKGSVTSKQIATDGVALIVNTSVTDVTDVTGAQVYELYANGTAIGGLSAAISREDGSGTRDAFDSLIKSADGAELADLEKFADCVSEETGTGAVKTQVSGNAAVLGYISLGSVDSTIKTLKFEGVEATAENVKSGDYKLSRPFNIVYTSEDALSDKAKAFIDFIMSAEGQEIVESMGYVSVI